MFEDFFEKNAPADEEIPDAERSEQIKAAVMERIAQESEEKKMKHRFLRPFIIAAAVVSVSAASLVTANAATDGAVIDTITKVITIFVDGKEVEIEAEYSEYTMEGGGKAEVLSFDLPDDAVSGVDGLAIAVEADSDIPTEITFSSEDFGTSEVGAEISMYYYGGSSCTSAEG